jgi:hypothetical protein
MRNTATKATSCLPKSQCRARLCLECRMLQWQIMSHSTKHMLLCRHGAGCHQSTQNPSMLFSFTGKGEFKWLRAFLVL